MEISGTDLFAVQKIWSEKDGAIYLNVIETYTDSKTEVYFLYKLSADGKTLEMNYQSPALDKSSIKEFPTEIDPKPYSKAGSNIGYKIFFRQ
jgi:hypothetical protein